ncbi:Wzt carbohydrate-binding domain-containing protein [Zwartia sp.]|uniref:Wzt carbohydrate-binding domain-containing protein n=1 Tax=Zwartia sp. TaxID=2978004 RepID=UPI00271AD539|nr:Wzt carbohydrate-binding domain-containing protein [Zwartia sp.]MDO9024817.1 Wzt carbohydrate-binding domain-containing protein [Zwartia sp.]
MSSKPNVVISARGLGKSYRNFYRPVNRLIQLLRPNTTGLYTHFDALKEISFDIVRGESVALIGRNGSGKSTLLQLIYGTLKPTVGQVSAQGKVAALLELGAGFDPEFTGLENLRMTATLYGIPDAQLTHKIQQMRDFADIGDFIEQPLKTYSTGMVVRLAFAVIAHVDAEILIVDEALAVGDAIFTQKCMRFIRAFKARGTLLFVSHDMAAVQNLCDRAIWLEAGRIKQMGSAKAVAESYLQYSLQEGAEDNVVLQTLPPATQMSGWATGHAQITRVELVNTESLGQTFFQGGELVSLRIKVHATRTLEHPIIGFLLRDRLGQDLFGENTLRGTQTDVATPIPAGKSATATFDFTLPYLPNGQYAIACSIADGHLHENTQHHFIHDALIVTISSNEARWGLVGIVCDQIQLECDDQVNRVAQIKEAQPPDTKISNDTLSTIFQRHTGNPCAKWQAYLQHYDRYFSGLKDKPLRLLEIGVQAGGSLEIWARYFKNAKTIVGCDIDPTCSALRHQDPRIKVLIGDINSPQTLESLSQLAPALDIIIDDGSHQSTDIICSFIQLFPRLTPGGIYVVEDLHCSYWESYGGGLFDPRSPISFFKKLIDIVNQEVWGISIDTQDFLSAFVPLLENQHTDPQWTFLRDIHTIEFSNSMCVIRKRSAVDNTLGCLMLSGQTPAKGSVSSQYAATEITVPDQTQNRMSRLQGHALEQDRESLFALQDEIAKLKLEKTGFLIEKSTLTTQVYEATKKFYDASVTIQELEAKLNQLGHTKSDAS